MGFTKLNLHPELLKSVKRMGFETPTPIQEKCIPEIRAGKDVVGQSLTGSGKTAAFGLPILEMVTRGKGIQALILTPTRELAVQNRDTLHQYSKTMNISISAVYGGVGMQPQIDSFKMADIIVATPGRLLDHLNRRTLKLNNAKILVLDEADKMFEMGFIEDVEEIIGHMPKERQTLLFSATMCKEVQHLIVKHLKIPVIIKEKIYIDKSQLKQVYYNTNQNEKFSLLLHLLKNKTSGLAIVFCCTRREVDVVERNLKMHKIHAMAVHGGLSQNKRLDAVNSLKKENIQVLVATDVAARGLDIQNISHIYNYDAPKTSEEYIHRIGRTARMGKKGEAVTLLTERDFGNLDNVLKDRTIQILKEVVPPFEKVRFNRESFQRQEQGQRPFWKKRFDNNKSSFNKPRYSKPKFRS